LRVAAAIKQLQFTWNAVKGATFYRFLESTDGGTVFNVVKGDLTETRLSKNVAVHLQDWAKTFYRVEACNGSGCTASQSLSVKETAHQVLGRFSKDGDEGIDFNAFGWAVALSADGGTLAIGDRGEDSGGNDAGAAYVYARDSRGIWSPSPVPIRAANPDPGDQFGYAVALSGDGNTLAVAAVGEDSYAIGLHGNQKQDSGGRTANMGAVYLYARDLRGDWQGPVYVKDIPGTGHRYHNRAFGASLALSEDGATLVVGAPTNAQETNNPGSAHVYSRDAKGNWRTLQAVPAANAADEALFGRAMALSGDGQTMLVMADLREQDGGVMVHVYERGKATFNRRQKADLKILDSGATNHTGSVMSLSQDGTRLAVHAADSGPVHVYARSKDSWVEEFSSNSGNYVALSGDGRMLAVGKDGALGGSFSLFVRSDKGWVAQSMDVELPDARKGNSFARALALSRDGQTLAVGGQNVRTVYLY
jgi:hypothetical protein